MALLSQVRFCNDITGQNVHIFGIWNDLIQHSKHGSMANGYCQ